MTRLTASDVNVPFTKIPIDRKDIHRTMARRASDKWNPVKRHEDGKL